MTRKDFILLATTILNLDLCMCSDEHVQRTMIAEEFADALAGTNPSFNRALFIQASIGIVPVTARRIV